MCVCVCVVCVCVCHYSIPVGGPVVLSRFGSPWTVRVCSVTWPRVVRVTESQSKDISNARVKTRRDEAGHSSSIQAGLWGPHAAVHFSLPRANGERKLVKFSLSPRGLWPSLAAIRYSHLSVCMVSRRGGGDSSVVRAPDSWLKGRGFESLLERRENFLLQGRLSVLTLISVSVPPPCYHSST